MVVFIIMKDLIREILNDYIFENLLLERRYLKDEIFFDRDGEKKIIVFYNDHSLESVGKERVPIEDIMDLIYEYEDEVINTVEKAAKDKKKGIHILNYYSPIPPHNDGFDLHCWIEHPISDEYEVTINTSIYHTKGKLKLKDDTRKAYINSIGNYMDNTVPRKRLPN